MCGQHCLLSESKSMIRKATGYSYDSFCVQEEDVLQQEVESKDGLTYYSWYVIPLRGIASTALMNWLLMTTSMLQILYIEQTCPHVSESHNVLVGAKRYKPEALRCCKCRELKPHRLVTATAVKNRLILLSITANARQWRKSQDHLKHMWKSLSIVTKT